MLDVGIVSKYLEIHVCGHHSIQNHMMKQVIRKVKKAEPHPVNMNKNNYLLL